MKKEIQRQINEKVERAFEAFRRDCIDDRNYDLTCHVQWCRLRNCQASVCTIGKWKVLRSYNTIVALIDSETDTLYDFLRMVYGYSSTSCQHIRKFEKDYCNRYFGCDVVYTWREA